MRFSQRLSADHLVLELREDKRGFGDVADRGRAQADVLDGAPALGYQLAKVMRRAEMLDAPRAAPGGVHDLDRLRPRGKSSPCDISPPDETRPG